MVRNKKHSQGGLGLDVIKENMMQLFLQGLSCGTLRKCIQHSQVNAASQNTIEQYRRPEQIIKFWLIDHLECLQRKLHL